MQTPPPPSPVPGEVATPPAIVTPSPAPTPAATASPFAYIVTPPTPAPGLPAVSQVALTDQTLHTGKGFTIIVTTVPEVTSVQVEAMGQRFALFPMGGGRFGATGTVPEVPASYLNHNSAVTVVAATADGKRTLVPLTVRLTR